MITYKKIHQLPTTGMVSYTTKTHSKGKALIPNNNGDLIEIDTRNRFARVKGPAIKLNNVMKPNAHYNIIPIGNGNVIVDYITTFMQYAPAFVKLTNIGGMWVYDKNDVNLRLDEMYHTGRTNSIVKIGNYLYYVANDIHKSATSIYRLNINTMERVMLHTLGSYIPKPKLIQSDDERLLILGDTLEESYYVYNIICNKDINYSKDYEFMREDMLSVKLATSTILFNTSCDKDKCCNQNVLVHNPANDSFVKVFATGNTVSTGLKNTIVDGNKIYRVTVGVEHDVWSTEIKLEGIICVTP